MSVKASVVVVTYGQRPVTERGLDALAGALGEQLGRSWELVLVDNASPDDTPALLRQWSDRAEVLLLQHNLDFAGGCNAGAARARGDVLVFLNNDTEVVPGALEALVAQVAEPGVAIAGPRLLFADGTIQHAGVGFLRNALGVMPQHVFHHQDGMLPAARGTYELDCVTGACLVIRRDVFEQLGGFDEGYRNGLEDVDLCLRARMAGHRVVYRGDVAFVHAEGASRGAGSDLWATPERLAAMRSNDLRFIGAWGAMLDEDVELAGATWDAELHEIRPTPAAGPAGVMLEGQPGGLAPAGDEARAILAACAAGGPLVAARDEPFPRVAPRLDPSLRALVLDALGREPVPGAPRIVVPAGAHAVHALDGAVLRRRAGSRRRRRADGGLGAGARRGRRVCRGRPPRAPGAHRRSDAATGRRAVRAARACSPSCRPTTPAPARRRSVPCAACTTSDCCPPWPPGALRRP